jgi:hypothetical protein
MEDAGSRLIVIGGKEYRLLPACAPLIYHVSEITALGHVDCAWDEPTRLDFSLEKGEVFAILVKRVESPATGEEVMSGEYNNALVGFPYCVDHKETHTDCAVVRAERTQKHVESLERAVIDAAVAYREAQRELEAFNKSGKPYASYVSSDPSNVVVNQPAIDVHAQHTLKAMSLESAVDALLEARGEG